VYIVRNVKHMTGLKSRSYRLEDSPSPKSAKVAAAGEHEPAAHHHGGPEAIPQAA
jgi:hypothetical protein